MVAKESHIGRLGVVIHIQEVADAPAIYQVKLIECCFPGREKLCLLEEIVFLKEHQLRFGKVIVDKRNGEISGHKKFEVGQSVAIVKPLLFIAAMRNSEQKNQWTSDNYMIDGKVHLWTTSNQSLNGAHGTIIGKVSDRDAYFVQLLSEAKETVRIPGKYLQLTTQAGRGWSTVVF